MIFAWRRASRSWFSSAFKALFPNGWLSVLTSDRVHSAFPSISTIYFDEPASIPRSCNTDKTTSPWNKETTAWNIWHQKYFSQKEETKNFGSLSKGSMFLPSDAAIKNSWLYQAFLCKMNKGNIRDTHYWAFQAHGNVWKLEALSSGLKWALEKEDEVVTVNSHQKSGMNRKSSWRSSIPEAWVATGTSEKNATSASQKWGQNKHENLG